MRALNIGSPHPDEATTMALRPIQHSCTLPLEKSPARLLPSLPLLPNIGLGHQAEAVLSKESTRQTGEGNVPLPKRPTSKCPGVKAWLRKVAPSRCPTSPRITVSSGGFKENDPNFPPYSRPDLGSQPRPLSRQLPSLEREDPPSPIDQEAIEDYCTPSSASASQPWGEKEIIQGN